MMKHKLIVLAAGSVILALASASPVSALDISVSAGSGSSGGTSATASVEDTSARLIIGGGSNVASAGLGTGDTDVNANVGTTSGPLIEASSTDGTTSADVNLGGFSLGGVNDSLNSIADPLGETLEGADVGGGPGGGGGAGGVAAAFAALVAADQQQLRIRCRNVLANPFGFDPDVIALCRLIERL